MVECYLLSIKIDMICRTILRPCILLYVNDFILYSFMRASTYTTSNIKTFIAPTLSVC